MPLSFSMLVLSPSSKRHRGSGLYESIHSIRHDLASISIKEIIKIAPIYFFEIVDDHGEFCGKLN